MYRTVALALHRAREERPDVLIEHVIAEIDIRFSHAEDSLHVFLHDENVTEAIREPAISRLASEVAREPAVRAAMVEKQREIVARVTAAGGGAVVEGRDIGTVVFPGADLKVFLDADVNERARRRTKDLSNKGRAVSEDQVVVDLSRRDADDRSRALAPLRAAKDALHLDTTGLTFDEQVQKIVAWAGEVTTRPTHA
jgi:cytidylate kinase